MVAATIFWSFGSWSTPRLPLPKNPFVMAVYEMLGGAVALFVMAVVAGEHLLPEAAPADSWLAWAYLVVFGSVVAFTSYVWVLSVAPISLVATYAYVNPVVAVFLGWLILSEPITLAIILGGGVVVASVALVIAAERVRKVPKTSVGVGQAADPRRPRLGQQSRLRQGASRPAGPRRQWRARRARSRGRVRPSRG